MFAKSNQYERWLDSVSAEYRYRDSGKYSDLEPDWATNNPCRAGKAIIDVALSYAERMQGGEAAPPAITVRKPTGLRVLDGRQRLFANESIGNTVFAHYELINPSERLERLVGLGANAALNGIRPGQDFLVSAAIDFMERFSASPAEASRIAGVTTATIESYMSTYQVRNALVSGGIEPQLANGTLAALAPFLTEEFAVLATAYKAIEDAGATVKQARELAAKMLKQPGRGRFIAIEQWLDEPDISVQVSNRRKKPRTSVTNIMAAAKALKSSLSDHGEKACESMTEQERRRFATLMNQINGRARKIAAEFSFMAIG